VKARETRPTLGRSAAAKPLEPHSNTLSLRGRQRDIIAILLKRDDPMPDLLVRGVDETLVKALKERAGAHGRSAEAEHREILAEALARPRRRSLGEVLASIPDVGSDADFERVDSEGKAPRVFD
jgi:plasmid stability protein